MAKKNILFAAFEASPFIKTGGLGDVSGALPVHLKNDKYDARVILPLISSIPEEYKNRWKEAFEKEQKLYLELGCGKGKFISKLSKQNQEINYIAIDLVDAMLGLAKRNVEQVFKEKNIETDNIILTRFDIDRILLILSEEDKIDRIYINFCNPWPKGKHRKKRLTHTRQLEKYKTFLKENGEIYFKTDDDDLFNSSLKYFEETGFKIIKKTYDLHSEPDFWYNIETEHEKMFSEQGIKIKAVIAKR